jgi:hypothetical protein
MNREPWVAYLVVTIVVIGMMYGKYLMGGGGDKSDEDKK